jgi:hypothetical protein
MRRRKLFTLAAGVSAVLCADVISELSRFRRSMRGKLFPLAAGVWAMLFAGVCVLWVRSCWVVDHVQLETPAREYYACTYRGSFILGTISGDELVFPPQPVLTYEALAADRFNDWTILEHLDGNPDVLSWLPHGQAIPAWAVAGVFALVPAVWVDIRRRRPRPPGCCPACGYDLRATPDRCPECGSIPAATPSSS